VLQDEEEEIKLEINVLKKVSSVCSTLFMMGSCAE